MIEHKAVLGFLDKSMDVGLVPREEANGDKPICFTNPSQTTMLAVHSAKLKAVLGGFDLSEANGHDLPEPKTDDFQKTTIDAEYLTDFLAMLKKSGCKKVVFALKKDSPLLVEALIGEDKQFSYYVAPMSSQ